MKGMEILSPEISKNTIEQCEAAFKLAQSASEKAVSFLREKCTLTSKFACADAPDLADLSELLKRAEASAEKLVQYRQDLDGHKRKALSQAGRAPKAAKTM